MRVLHARHLDDAGAVPKGNPDPSEAEVREAISGNLCRCTGYQNIIAAVGAAAAVLRKPAAPSKSDADPAGTALAGTAPAGEATP